MNRKTRFLLSAIVFGTIGALFAFTPYKILKNTLNLGLGLRHNDHVMTGTIGLIIAVVSIYKIFRMEK